MCPPLHIKVHHDLRCQFFSFWIGFPDVYPHPAHASALLVPDKGERRPGGQEEHRDEDCLIADVPPFALAPDVVKCQDLRRREQLSAQSACGLLCASQVKARVGPPTSKSRKM